MYDQLLKDQRTITVGATDGPFLGGNVRRKMIIATCPPPFDTPYISDNTLQNNASLASTGLVASYTVPAGVQAELESASFQTTAVTGAVVALKMQRGATIYQLQQYTTQGVWTAPIPLLPGDIISWIVVTVAAAGTGDFTINVRRERVPARVTLSFGPQPAVLDNGLNMYAGGTPLILTTGDVGKAMREEIRAIGSVAGLTIGVQDLFTP